MPGPYPSYNLSSEGSCSAVAQSAPLPRTVTSNGMRLEAASGANTLPKVTLRGTGPASSARFQPSSALGSPRERTPQTSEPNQPAAVVGFCFFTTSLDSQSYRISTYKLWKVQESLNKQGEGGPGPRGLWLPWQAALPLHRPVSPCCVWVSPGLDLWAQPEAPDLSQPWLWRWHSRRGTGGGFSAVTSKRIGISPFP